MQERSSSSRKPVYQKLSIVMRLWPQYLIVCKQLHIYSFCAHTIRYVTSYYIPDLEGDEPAEDTLVLEENSAIVIEVQAPRESRAQRRSTRQQWIPLQDEDMSVNTAFLGPELPCSQEVLSPFEYFKSFFTEDLFNLIVDETNLYSAEKNINKPLNITRNEMEQWIGLVCYFSIVRLPNTSMHWCRQLYPLCDIAGDTMSRDRFEAIKSNFHLVNNSLMNEARSDKFLKVRPMIDHIRKKFQDLPKIQNLCVDEQLVSFKGKSSAKQYIPNKPKKWGYKLFVLADEKGMMYDFIPYTGKIEPVEDPSVPDLKPSANSVLHLAQNISPDVNHLLFFDNWFTSLPLMDHLASRGIWCCGTVRPSRLAGIPLDMKCQKRITRKGRGAFEASKITQENSEAVYVKWYDNRVVNMLSTFAKIHPMTTVLRFDSKNKRVIEIQCPDIVKKYNKSMGGVDLADQLISLYKIPLRSKKYYMRLVFHMIDMVIVNAWLLYRRDASSLNLQRKDILPLASFKLLLSFDLMRAGKTVGKKRGRPSSTSEPVKPPKKGCHRPSVAIQKDGVGHIPKISEKRQRCKRENCCGRTNVYCKKCNVNLCLNSKSNCFEAFHE